MAALGRPWPSGPWLGAGACLRAATGLAMATPSPVTVGHRPDGAGGPSGDGRRDFPARVASVADRRALVADLLWAIRGGRSPFLGTSGAAWVMRGLVDRPWRCPGGPGRPLEWFEAPVGFGSCPSTRQNALLPVPSVLRRPVARAQRCGPDVC